MTSIRDRRAQIEIALEECLPSADCDVVSFDGDRFLRVYVPAARDLGIEVPLIPLRQLAERLERFLS